MGHAAKVLALGAIGAILLALMPSMWAASSIGAARLREHMDNHGGGTGSFPFNGSAASVGRDGLRTVLPGVVRFQEDADRGLLVRAWVNGVGEYTFAVDTGAGSTILSEHVARAARVSLSEKRATIGGLSGTGLISGREAHLRSLAIGDRDNFLSSNSPVIVTNRLPPGVDGVLDPTESYWPLGYSIDMPNGEISAFDPRLNPLSYDDAPVGGTVVPWLTDPGSRRPFVMLDLGRRALLDTGSGFGLAISEKVARASRIIVDGGRDRDDVRDLTGGRVTARRIAPITVHIGSLVLRRIPTDLVLGASNEAPILLGRDALQPFHLTFDPVNRLIRIAPQEP